MAELRFAGILGTGHYAPEKILSNADLEKIRYAPGNENEAMDPRQGFSTHLC